MAELTAARHNALPYPIYGQPFVLAAALLDADGDGVAGSSPDSEISKNFDTAADCTNEFVDISGIVGGGYLILTATEMTCDVAYIEINSTGAKSTHVTLYPRKLPVVRTGTSQTGAATTITLDSGASAIDDYYNGMVIAALIDSVIELRVIGDYVGSTKVATIQGPNWVVTPDADDTFTIYLPEGAWVSKADVVGWNGTAPTTPTVAGVPKVDVTHYGGSAGSFSSGVPAVNTTQLAGVSTAPARMNDYFNAMLPGTSESGGTTTTMVDTALTNGDDFYNGWLIVFLNGTNARHMAVVTDFDAATDTVTFWPAAPAAVGAGGTFILIPTVPGSHRMTLQAINDLLDSPDGVETGWSLRGLLRVMGAILAGEVSGGGTGTEVFRDVTDTKTRVTSTPDAAGNRTGVTYDKT